MSMIHDITAGAPRNKLPKRKGRGRSAGQGKTAGRGTKGSGARSGTAAKVGHEHGQTPIYRRLPKRGFSNHPFARRFHVVNLGDLDRFEDGATVDAAALREAGLVPNTRDPVKILGNGTLGKKLTVIAGWFSKSAHEKITQAGGAAQNLSGEAFTFPKPKKRFVSREEAERTGRIKTEASDSAPPAENA